MGNIQRCLTQLNYILVKIPTNPTEDMDNGNVNNAEKPLKPCVSSVNTNMKNMPTKAGFIETVRDFWNSTHIDITRYEQMKERTGISHPFYDELLIFHRRLQHIMENWENE
jgi:hypothetical protein